jgi:hypothetical protein
MLSGERAMSGRDLFQRIMRLVLIDPVTGCWMWCGHLDRHGYGRVTIDGRPKLAHRVVYELCVGPIPAGLVLDHIICDRPSCVRPDHCQPSTQLANVMRGKSPPAENARKLECKSGHPFDEANTYRHGRRRQCRACNAAAVRRYGERLSARKEDIAAQEIRDVPGIRRMVYSPETLSAKRDGLASALERSKTPIPIYRYLGLLEGSWPVDLSLDLPSEPTTGALPAKKLANPSSGPSYDLALSVRKVA